MKATIHSMVDANTKYYYFIIERPNHATIYSNNYKSEKMARKKLQKKIQSLIYKITKK